MTERSDTQRHGRHAADGKEPLRIGWLVFIALAVLTIVEFAFAVVVDANLPILVVIAIMKAGLIMYYFMHLLRIWRTGEEES
jgi:caa(3)-type oxidase subunit IV